MTGATAVAEPARAGASWLERWEPEDETFWETRGKAIAWRTLAITTANLTMAFATWFLVSALVVRLGKLGFDLSTTQKFWLTAMPGLAGGTFRIVHTFLCPLYGTRRVVSLSTASLLLPLIGWFFAVQNSGTPYWVLLALAFLAGLGGGNFSSFMPSTSLFFPKRLQGTALGIQAGIGNFGVSLVQFLTPWVIGFAMIGSAQVNTETGKDAWLQNAAFIWIPLVAFLALVAWLRLKSVPVRANVREQFDIFGEKHTWLMTSLYFMTFGSFAGFSATFPLLIDKVYGGFDDAPDPLTYAFLGPLVGSAARVAAGPLSDKFGGGRLTQISGIGLIGCAVGVCFFLTPSSTDQFTWFVLCMIGLFFFSGIGNASTFKQMPMIFEPRQAGGVIGWTAAIAAYGPFIFSVAIAAVISAAGDPIPFFIGAAVFYAANVAINWWYYLRGGAERPC
ncbi:MAG: NarK/NasA family nitrate transporter [Thermoleophilia bacterium]|nr:NarK/NasA family nitrate transporter [Thermoleophilia bacterium]